MNRSYSKIRHIQEANQRLEKRLVENVIVEGDVTEANTITGLVKGLVQGGKNLVSKAMGTAAKKGPQSMGPLKGPQYFDELPVSAVDDLVNAGASRSTATLLAKLGTVKMSDVLTRFLSPVRDEVVVALRDFKNVIASLPKPKATADRYDPASMANFKLNQIGDQLNTFVLNYIQVPKGQSVDLGQVYKNLKGLRNELSGIELTLPMNPTSKKLLMIFKRNLDDAIVKFDDAIADIITK